MDLKSRLKAFPQKLRKEKILSRETNAHSVKNHQTRPSTATAAATATITKKTFYETESEFYKEYAREKSNRSGRAGGGLGGIQNDGQDFPFNDDGSRGTLTSIEFISDPATEEEILKSIGPHYYESEFDSFQMLNNLPARLDMNYIATEKKKLKRQLFVVTKKVSVLINQKQDQCQRELALMEDVKKAVDQILIESRLCRFQLKSVMDCLTRPCLQLLATHQRQQRIEKIIESLLNLNTMVQDERLSITPKSTAAQSPESTPERDLNAIKENINSLNLDEGEEG